ncbi:AEC family transporter [Kineococcus sp. SYSU DK001]|uniref:AEC family transporter n=1 Tax=Kineococcus sp. SYSU DK001 TaxID=3383122 RepID=UPI003D7D93DF
MTGLLTGLAVVATVVAVGYLVGRTGVLGPSGQTVVSRLVFFVGTPALLLQTLAEADVHVLFSEQLVAASAGVLCSVLVWLVVAGRWLRLSREDLVVGGLAGSFVNAANIGLPIAAYVLGDVTAVLPAMLLQMVVLTPVALGILDVTRHSGGPGRAAAVRRALAPLVNPILLASVVGVVLSASGWRLPTAVAQPLDLLAGLAIPGALLAFGISLHGGSAAGWRSGEVLLATGIKAFLQPAATFAVARWVLRMDDPAVHAATVVAALPTAQNVFTYAVRYGVARDLARDTVLLTTVLFGPVIVLISVVLG